jgi:hypothetical protein
MTHTSLNKWIKVAESRRAAPLASSRMRACRHFGDFYALAKRASHGTTKVELDVGRDEIGADQALAVPAPAAVFGTQSAKIFASALVVIAAAMAFDLLILWVAAGRVIDHLPL